MLQHAATMAGFKLAELGANALLAPAARIAQYTVNDAAPNLLPGPETLLQLYYAGVLDPARLESRIKMHAIDYTSDPLNKTYLPWLWHRAVEIGRPQAGLPEFQRWFRQGRITEEQLLDRIKRDGLKASQYLPLIKDDWDNLDLGTVIAALNRGLITEDIARQFMFQLGITRTYDQDLILGIMEGPQLVESLTLRNREQITDQQLDTYLKWRGVRGQTERDLLASLRFEIPGPSDLTRYAVRHVFEPSVWQHYHYDEEMPQDYLDWHAKQGLGQSIHLTDSRTGDTADITWAAANWIAHWVWPAPTQAYTMLHRLRATGGQNGGPRNVDGLVFDRQDLNRLLRGNDYPPYWRPYLAAISYRTITRGETDIMFRNGTINRAEAVEQYQDQGNTQTNAELIADSLSNDVRWEQIRALRARQLMKVQQAYQRGTLSRDEASLAVWKLTLPNLAMVEWANGLDRADQQRRANDDRYVQTLLDTIDNQQTTAIVQQAINSIRSSFVRLEISSAQMANLLNATGVSPERARQYVQLWTLQLQTRGKELSASQVIRFFERGLINGDVAAQRLALLGYHDDAISLILSDANVTMQARVATQQRQQARDARTRQRAQEAVVRAQQQQVRREQSALTRHSSPAMIKRYLKRGLISEQLAIQRLAFLGWPQDDIKRLIDDALHSGSEPITTPPETPQAAPDFTL